MLFHMQFVLCFIKMLKCSNAHARMLGWMCTFELQKHQNYSTLIQRNRWQSQEMAFEQTLLFHYVQSAKISRKWNGGIKGGSERQWINASKNIAMNVSTNDSCRSCTKYKQCLINCYWMVNWIFEPRELVMPRINICRKAFWAQSFALELWIKTEIMVHIRNMNIGFEIRNINMV